MVDEKKESQEGASHAKDKGLRKAKHAGFLPMTKNRALRNSLVWLGSTLVFRGDAEQNEQSTDDWFTDSEWASKEFSWKHRYPPQGLKETTTWCCDRHG